MSKIVSQLLFCKKNDILEVMQIIFSKATFFKSFGFIFMFGAAFILGLLTNSWWISQGSIELLNPFVESGKQVSYPLLKYSITNLQTYDFKASTINLERVIAEEQNYTSFLFSYNTEGRKMTGQINIPDSVTANPEQENKVIVMLRGFVPPEIYTTGVGTKNAAAAFAADGYITVAPDFFGYGESSPEPENSWVTRFEKPITVVELIKSIKQNGIPLDTSENLEGLVTDELTKTKNITAIGMWAHSNGGQIALTTLEILREPIPTTLWAPVTAPFPYSIAYFSDELADEGKSQRKWIAMFEEDYDVYEFSHTQHLEDLTGPIQIQHGDADDAALIYWSEEFVQKVAAENERRNKITESLEELENEDTTATGTAQNASESEKKMGHTNAPLEPVDIDLITYPNTNHNLVPNWNKAVQKDIQFFEKNL